jgi:benzoyl-CoA reductase subunit C
MALQREMDVETDRILTRLAACATDPLGYARAWKEANNRPVIGSFPMNFPGELAHAAGALPLILQESSDPITYGHGLLFPFYCGYTRSMVDQAAKGDLSGLDAIMFGDHCVQLLGAADAIRMQLPNTRVIFFQLISSMCDPWTLGRSIESFGELKAELEDFIERPIEDGALHGSIRLFNHNRQLLRRLYAMRESGEVALTATQMQHTVKSSMIMDKAEHTALIEALLADLERNPRPRAEGLRLHLSGHFCQAPKPEILEMIESCGAIIVGDDLYHGFRYISTDVSPEGDPIAALAQWYMARNTGVPCPTRVQNDLARKGAWDDRANGEVL